MALPLPVDMCFELEIDLSFFLSLSIELPGGLNLQAKLDPGKFPSLSEISAKLLGELNAAMTPLMPFFRILDVVLALIECVKAIPDALGPPPDPTKVAKCLSKLLKVAAALARLIPVISIAIAIQGICKVIGAVILGLILELENMLKIQAKLDLALDRALLLAGDPATAQGAANLNASIDCAQADLDLMLEISVASVTPVNRFIQLLNLLAQLAGLPELLVIEIEAGVDITAALAPLRAFVQVLNGFCESIPV